MKTMYEDGRGCYRKRGFETARAARRFFKKLKKQYPDILDQYPYDCKSCGQFHLTKNKHAEGKIL